MSLGYLEIVKKLQKIKGRALQTILYGRRSLDCRKKSSTFGLHVWSMPFVEDRARVPWYGSLEEAGAPHLRDD